MNLKKLIFATFPIFSMICSAELYAAEPQGISHSHMNEINYPSQQKDTLGKARMYVPEAKTDIDREVAPGQLPQYQTPLHYGYKEIKFKSSADMNTSSSLNNSTPQFGEKVSKRRATKNSFPIRHSDGLYFYREGIFYLQKGDTYEIHPPHVGFRVPSIPSSRRDYTFEGITYYYYYGTFYVYNTDVKMYDVVFPPAGAIVDWVPEYAEEKVVDGELHYVANGVEYKEISLSFGNSKWYQIVSVDEKKY